MTNISNNEYEELESNMVHAAVDDFQKFIEFINLEKPILSVKRATLGKNDCFKLNSMLKNKRDVTAPYYTQLQYPIIDLMFNIALQGKLFTKSNEKGKLILTQTTSFEKYQNLNEYEKYVYLLQTYWTKYDFEYKIQTSFNLSNYITLLLEMSHAKDEKTISENFFSTIGSYYYHLVFFGFGNFILNDKEISGNNNIIAIFYPNEFGIKISKFLMKEAYQHINHSYYKLAIGMDGLKNVDNQNELTDKILSLKNENPFNVFKNIFPNKDINKTVDISEDLVHKNGVYLFKVSLEYDKGIWRTISLSDKHTLKDLHLAIQDAFNFDNDHLYAFYINGNSRTVKPINGYPYGYEIDENFDDNELTSDKATIGDLDLYKGTKITYVFDFGDSWKFDIVLKDIDKDSPIPIKPTIIESMGEPLNQYGFDDE